MHLLRDGYDKDVSRDCGHNPSGNDKTDIIAESFQQVLCDVSGTACNQ